MNARFVWPACWALILIVAGRLHADDPPARVGALGDPRQLEVRGCRTFENGQVAAAIRRQLDVCVAAHPAAPLHEYLSLLAKKTRDGYANTGFPHAQVNVSFDRQQGEVVVNVRKEGPRYHCGEVRVAGVPDELAERIRDALTQPRPPEGCVAEQFTDETGQQRTVWLDADGYRQRTLPALWQPGEPASMVAPTLEQAQSMAATSLNDGGYPWSECRATLNPTDDAAQLHIEVARLGPPARLTRILVGGNKRDSDDEILDYLDLAPGVMLTRSRRTQIDHRMWQSARFADWHLDVYHESGPTGEVVLFFDVVEYSKAPRLTEPFSRAEASMVKLSQWLAAGQGVRRDLKVAIDADRWAANGAVSIERGMAFRLRPPTPDAASPIDHTLTWTTEEIGLYDHRTRRKLVFPLPSRWFVGEVTCRLAPDIDQQPARPFKHRFSFRLQREPEFSDQPKWHVRMRMMPAFFVALLHEHDAEHRFEGDVLVVQHDSTQLRVDSRTGELLSCEYDAAGETGRAKARLVEGALRQQMAQLNRTFQDVPNQFDPEHPVSSTLAFLLEDEFVWWVACSYDAEWSQRRQREAWRVLAELLRRGPLERVDRMVAKWGRKKGKRDGHSVFRLPADPEAIPAAFRNQSQGEQYMLGSFAYAHYIVPYDSWPYLLWRAYFMDVVGEHVYEQADLDALCTSEASGPFCLLMMALLFEIRGQPMQAASIAQKGLAGLTENDFRRDYAPLLDRETLCGMLLCWAGEQLTLLNDDEARLVGEAMFNGNGQPLVDLCRRLRAETDLPVDQILGDLLDQGWRRGLRKAAADALRDIYQRNTQGAEPEPT